MRRDSKQPERRSCQDCALSSRLADNSPPYRRPTMSESRSTLRRVAQMKGEPIPEFYATTLANTTDQIATTTATRGDITSHEGDVPIPAVVQDAQRYDWRSDPRANGALAALTDALRKEADHDRA